MVTSKRSDRIKNIFQILKTHGNVSTVFLSKSLNITESSIRRDINYMVNCGDFPNLRNIYGGVILEIPRDDKEIIFERKLSLNKLLKQSIAQESLNFINKGDNIFIDSGTTCLYLAKILGNIPNLCVITADIKIADELGKHSSIESSIIGGIVRPGYYTIGGIRALENLDSFMVNKIFMSVDSLDVDYGITNASEFEVGVKKKLLQKNAEIYIIVDHTKINSHSVHHVASLSSVNTMITDNGIDSITVEKIRNKGIEVVIAQS